MSGICRASWTDGERQTVADAFCGSGLGGVVDERDRAAMQTGCRTISARSIEAMRD
jgi:hypothetical protein